MARALSGEITPGAAISVCPALGPVRMLIPVAVATLLTVVALLTVAPVPAGAVLVAPQIHTVAGHGGCTGSEASGGSCDGVPAKSVPIGTAASVAAIPGGGYLYVDSTYDLVRQVSASGTVTTVAGNGTATDQDGVAAVQSGLNDPVAVALVPGGGFLVTEAAGAVVRYVSPGPPGVATIVTIAGTGTPGYNGASGPATTIQLNYPTDAELMPNGQVLIADSHNGLVRLLSAAAPGATMSTIAGGGPCDDSTYACEGLPATGVALHDPWSVSPIAGGAGGFLIAENDQSGDNTIRQVSAAGAFTTVAGVPGAGWAFGGDGGAATAARLSAPQGVTSLPGGGFLIADTGNNRIRQVASNGTITTIAGTGDWALAGDGGPAANAALSNPTEIAPYTVGAGQYLIADSGNGVVREITTAPVSTFAFTPAAPPGRNGWFLFSVSAKVTGSGGAKSNCVVDPATPPAVFAQIATGCPLNSGAQIVGNGIHTVWAASVNSFGDQENPISVTVKIDSLVPVMACEPAPTFRFGQRRTKVTATVSDPYSGPVSPVVSATVQTNRPGRHTVQLTGANNAGTTNDINCRYTVLPRALRPAPAFGYAILSGRRYASVRRLVVTRVAADAAVDVGCQGSGCPWRNVRNVTGRLCRGRPCTARGTRHGSRARTVDLTALLSGHRLAPRARLTIIVTAPGAVGRVWLLALRAGRRPAESVKCLEPGSSRPGVGCRIPK